MDSLEAELPPLRPARRRRRKSSHAGESAALRPKLQRLVRTSPLLVDRVDWPSVMAGVKTEWRRYGIPQSVDGGRPVLLYSLRPHDGGTDLGYAFLERTWREPIGAISEESLEREGFPGDLTGFRRYIEGRYPKGGFRPMAYCRAYRIHLWTPDETPAMGEWALRALFGDEHP